MKALKTALLTIVMMVMVMAWAQNGAPQIIDSTQFTFANEANQMIVVGNYVYIRTSLSVSGQLQIVQINLITKQPSWSRNIVTTMGNVVMDGHGLVATPTGSICYPDGDNIIAVSDQNQVAWTRNLTPYRTGGLGFNLTADEDFLLAYSGGSDLVLLNYDTGDILGNWHIPTNGLASCGSHSAFRAMEDSTFFCVDTMPMGTLYNTGIKLSKVKIINNTPITVWQYQIDDLSDSRAAVDGNIIYLQGQQVINNGNSLIYPVIDSGNNYVVETTIDVSGPDTVTTVNGMKIWNHRLLVVARTRIGDDPNDTGGRFANTILYNSDGSAEWQINQYMSPFCTNKAVTFTNDAIYVLGTARPTYEAWQQQTMWLTEIGATVGTVDPTVPAVTTNFTCYPNPFRGSTSVKFNQIDNSPTTVAIYNTRGQLVRTLINSQKLSPGEHTVAWDGKTNSGQPVAAGVYFYKMLSGRFSSTRKMIMMK